jgi:hypothetical protein
MTSGKIASNDASTTSIDNKESPTTTTTVTSLDSDETGGVDKLKRIIRRMRIQVGYLVALLRMNKC